MGHERGQDGANGGVNDDMNKGGDDANEVQTHRHCWQCEVGMESGHGWGFGQNGGRQAWVMNEGVMGCEQMRVGMMRTRRKPIAVAAPHRPPSLFLITFITSPCLIPNPPHQHPLPFNLFILLLV